MHASGNFWKRSMLAGLQTRTQPAQVRLSPSGLQPPADGLRHRQLDLIRARDVCGSRYRGVTYGTPRSNRVGGSEDVTGQHHPCAQIVFTSVSPHVGWHDPRPFPVEATQIATYARIAIALCYSSAAERRQRRVPCLSAS